MYFEQPETSTCCMVQIPVNNTSVTICVATELLSTSCIKHDVTIPVNNTICTYTDLLRWAALNSRYRFVVHRLETDRAQIRYSPYKICCVVYTWHKTNRGSPRARFMPMTSSDVWHRQCSCAGQESGLCLVSRARVRVWPARLDYANIILGAPEHQELCWHTKHCKLAICFDHVHCGLIPSFLCLHNKNPLL